MIDHMIYDLSYIPLYIYVLSFNALFSSFPLAKSRPRDLQITAHK